MPGFPPNQNNQFDQKDLFNKRFYALDEETRCHRDQLLRYKRELADLQSEVKSLRKKTSVLTISLFLCVVLSLFSAHSLLNITPPQTDPSAAKKTAPTAYHYNNNYVPSVAATSYPGIIYGSTAEYKDEEKEVTVWLSRTGTRYHSKSNCSNMKSPIKVTLEDALSQGRTPCSKCKPPR